MLGYVLASLSLLAKSLLPAAISEAKLVRQRFAGARVVSLASSTVTM